MERIPYVVAFKDGRRPGDGDLNPENRGRSDPRVMAYALQMSATSR
jgi:hypothetical protein